MAFIEFVDILVKDPILTKMTKINDFSFVENIIKDLNYSIPLSFFSNSLSESKKRKVLRSIEKVFLSKENSFSTVNAINWIFWKDDIFDFVEDLPSDYYINDLSKKASLSKDAYHSLANLPYSVRTNIIEGINQDLSNDFLIGQNKKNFNIVNRESDQIKNQNKQTLLRFLNQRPLVELKYSLTQTEDTFVKISHIEDYLKKVMLGYIDSQKIEFKTALNFVKALQKSLSKYLNDKDNFIILSGPFLNGIGDFRSSGISLHLSKNFHRYHQINLGVDKGLIQKNKSHTAYEKSWKSINEQLSKLASLQNQYTTGTPLRMVEDRILNVKEFNPEEFQKMTFHNPLTLKIFKSQVYLEVGDHLSDGIQIFKLDLY